MLTPCSSGRCRRLGDKRLDRRVGGARIAGAAVLDVELEPARGAQPGNRRRVDRERSPVLKNGKLGVQPLERVERQQRAILALVERLEQTEHERGAVVGLAVDEAVAVHRADVLHRRVLEDKFLQLRGEPAGDLHARGILHLCEDEKVTLVLVRHEARPAGCGTSRRIPAITPPKAMSAIGQIAKRCLGPAQVGRAAGARSRFRRPGTRRFFSPWWALMMMAASAGDSVSAMIPETTIEIATVMANCLYSVPVTPPRNATGRNTASSTSTIEISAPAISVIACFAASRGTACAW